MRILITGNLGYVGPVVAAHLRASLPGATLLGFDTG
ncbi:MAG: NAD-dependent epimerase, partial [Acetobacteraceae bacterium]|nr:NAD-dependent epimerase [Acetobacteraceae bacterium]